MATVMKDSGGQTPSRAKPKKRKSTPVRGMIDSKAQKRNYAVNLHPYVFYPSPKAKATGKNNKGGRAVVKALRRTREKGDT